MENGFYNAVFKNAILFYSGVAKSGTATYSRYNHARQGTARGRLGLRVRLGSVSYEWISVL